MIPGLLMTIVIAIMCYIYVDNPDEWWYFSAALTGGLSLIVVSFMSASMVTNANIRATYKIRHTIKFSYKIAHRTGIAVTFLSLGMCGISIHILLAIFKSIVFSLKIINLLTNFLKIGYYLPEED